MALASLLKPLQKFLGSQPAESPAAAPEVEAAPQAPVSLAHAWHPEPNALKLQINRLLMPLGEKRTYVEAESASDSPLAQALFAIGGLDSVEIESASVTVLMSESADWDSVMERVPDVVRVHLEAGHPAVIAATSKRYSFGFREVPSRTPEEQFKLVQQLLDTEVNPAVASHGGFFKLLDVKENRVFVQLGGGCQGCGMVDVTLRQGVEQRLREVMPELEALIDTTDHASGSNPFYQASK